MSTRRAITIAAIVGTVLLIPIVAILALGFYGSSITGDFPLAEDQGPVLQIAPSVGTTGSTITIRGNDWIPRTLVEIEMSLNTSRPSIAADGTIVETTASSPAIFLGEIIASRAGTFSIDTQLPTTIPITGKSSIEFRATATYLGGEVAGESSTIFNLIAGPGSVETTITVGPSGKPAATGYVELLGDHGEILAAVPISADGTARFTGLPLEATYDIRVRVPGYEVLSSSDVTVATNHPTQVSFKMHPGSASRLIVGGIPAPTIPDGHPNSNMSQTHIALIDLPSLSPIRPSSPQPLPAAWAIESDSNRGQVFVVDEVATQINVFDALTGTAKEPIALTSALQVSVTDNDGRPISNAAIGLFWSIHAPPLTGEGRPPRQWVFVREASSDDSGKALIGDLISGNTYEVVAAAEGYIQQIPPRITTSIRPNVVSTATVILRRSDTYKHRAHEARVRLEQSQRGQVTGLAIADISLDPNNGHLYVTGSDLNRGHLFVINPEKHRIVHEWPVPAGVGDVIPSGDGTTVLIANRPESTVTRVNAKTGTVELQRLVPSWPEALARDISGNVYVASLHTGTISKLNPDTLAVEHSRRLKQGVHRLVVDEQTSTLLVSNLWTSTVTGLNTKDLSVRFMIPVPTSPQALAIDPETGTLIVGSSEDGTVTVYSPKTFELQQSLKLGVPINDVVVVSTRSTSS